MADEDDGFFSRWSRRKAQAKVDVARQEARVPADPGPDPLAGEERENPTLAPLGQREGFGVEPAAAEPPPTLADVAGLTRESDYTRFVAPGVDEGVKRAALKKMFFSDPHFNTMDGLDVYIDDYNTPDPLPASMLRRMWQSKSLGLFDDEAPTPGTQASPDGAPSAPVPESAPAPAAAADPCDEDTDLRLQSDDDAGRPGAREGARPERG